MAIARVGTVRLARLVPWARRRGSASRTDRLVWVDAARGYSVLAVVLFHVLLWRSAWPAIARDGLVWDFWGAVNQALGSVRMPLLLAISGLVLSRQIGEGLRRTTTGFRAANNYYLYVVWLAVYAAVSAVVTGPSMHHRVEGWSGVLQLVVPATTLWYVYALALYIPTLALCRRVPPWAVLAVLVVLSVTMHTLRLPDLWAKVPELFVFFALGVYGSQRLRALAAGTTWGRLGVAVLVAAAITAVGARARSPFADALLFVPRGVAFLSTCVLAIALAVRWAPVRSLGVAMGRRTLAVYVQHPLWLALAGALATGSAARGLTAALGVPVVAFVFPLALTVAVAALSIGTQVVAEGVGLRWLFEMPPWLRARFGRGIPPAPAAMPVSPPEHG